MKAHPIETTDFEIPIEPLVFSVLYGVNLILPD